MNSKFDKIAPGIANKLQFLTDSILIVSALTWSFDTMSIVSSKTIFWFSIVAVGSWTIGSAMTRLYSPHTPRSLTDYITLRFLGVVGVTTIIVLLDRFVFQHTVFFPLTFMVLFFGAGTISRLFVFQPLAHMAPQRDPVLIVGSGPLAAYTYEHLLQASPEQRRQVIGFISLDEKSNAVSRLKAPILGTADELYDILDETPVSEVYFSARVMEHGKDMQQLVNACERIGMPFAIPMHSLRFERARLLSPFPASDGYLHYMSTAQKPIQYALKRLIDIVSSASALVLLSPLLVVIALAIKSTSKGPLFFKQERVGLLGCRFNLLKFRSMVSNAEELKERLLQKNEQTGPVFKIKNDPRITSIGRFIRKYSIDELPQLVNVLRGDMTIVGPRPALPSEVSQYKAWQRRRLSVRPGLTCYWQVGGRNEIDFDQWMRLDLRYVDHWNLAVDMHLILQTFPVVLAGRGAS